MEIHAELCYAEALLMTALLTFLEDQSLVNLVRGAFRIRTCHQSYKYVLSIIMRVVIHFVLFCSIIESVSTY